MTEFSAKFFGKNVDDAKFADYDYIGSASLPTIRPTHADLIRIGESIAGPVNGPMIALIGNTMIVLKA